MQARRQGHNEGGLSMGKVRGKVLAQWQGEDLYQSLKKRYEGEYMGLDELDGLAEAEAQVKTYFDMVAKELEEGLQ